MSKEDCFKMAHEAVGKFIKKPIQEDELTDCLEKIVEAKNKQTEILKAKVAELKERLDFHIPHWHHWHIDDVRREYKQCCSRNCHGDAIYYEDRNGFYCEHCKFLLIKNQPHNFDDDDFESLEDIRKGGKR